MLDSWGAALRLLRQRQGLTLATLAARTSYSDSYLSNLEAGRKKPTPGVVARCENVLGCAPLLSVLYEIEKGDPVRRRALLGGTFAVAATALLTTIDGPAALAAVMDSSLRAATGGDTDWDALAADFNRRHLLNPSEQFGQELAGQLAVAQHRIAQGDTGAARGAALLAMTYGLWLADTDRVPTAHALYSTAAALADHSGDRRVRGLVRARAASRGPYEGWTAHRAEHAIREALELADNTGPAALEAHSAAVHLAALTGRLDDGRAAVQAMFAAAERIDDGDGPSAYQRALNFQCYLECRVGSLADAERAYARADTTLAAVPLWHADATLYLARALVAAGGVEQGVELALATITGQASPTRILRLGVRDVLSVVPAGSLSDAVRELRGYASTGPAPWETINA